MLGAACFWHPRARAIDTGIEGSACNYKASRGKRGTAGAPTKGFRWRILGGPVMKTFPRARTATDVVENIQRIVRAGARTTDAGMESSACN